MKFFKKIRRHAAMASGNFDTIFKGIEIPPLPHAIQQLLSEINSPEPDIDKLAALLSSETGLAAKVIKTVNSSLYGLRVPVGDIKHAVTLLGLNNIRSLALGYAALDALPTPKQKIFDHQAFWADSLLRAFMARGLSKTKFPSQAEEAFTASLLADVALPVLLCFWSEYYIPVFEEWLNSGTHLSDLEKSHFGWDHSQAGAWVGQTWDLPEETICFMAAHHFSLEEIKEHGLENSIAVPIAIAAHSTSVLRPGTNSAKEVFNMASELLEFSSAEYLEQITILEESFSEVLALFDIQDERSEQIIANLKTAAEEETQ